MEPRPFSKRSTFNCGAGVLAMLGLLWTAPTTAAPTWAPPPEPQVRPQIPDVRQIDADANAISDAIENRVDEIQTALQRERSPATIGALQAELDKPIRIEVVFKEQITQAQIDGFLALGGDIVHVYKAVSYGWVGDLPRSAVAALPGAMGSSLVVAVEDPEMELHLDGATQTGRVRPIWAAGFAGSISGFDGNSNITIAVLDTGVDDSHTDLSGRQEYWMDYSGDAEATPRDIGQHGSHVAGIALGTGASHGSATATLRYTDSGDLTGVPAGSGFPSFIHLPATSLTFTHDATWVGGGSTDLFGAFSPNGGGGLSALSASTFGASGIVEANTFTPSTANRYSGFLTQSAGGTITKFAIVNTATNYPAVGDGFNTFRGVCPTCRWAGAKVFTNAGSGSGSTIGMGMDDMVVQRIAHGIKVANLSLGTVGNPGLDPTVRAKANTMVDNGIVVVVSAGNDGAGTGGANVVDDPGRAAKVLTVAASNDVNELTEYSSSGFLSPGVDEDLKPDVMAPGGSDYYSYILSVDSNDADAESTSFADRVSNDYYNIKGTSMAAPFAAGAAALVIDALQDAGLVWDFSSSDDALLVKMLMNAAATESNALREAGTGFDPTLGRAATPKDRFEGYGIINPDAAVEAASLAYTGGALAGSTAGGLYDRRAWGRHVSLTSGTNISATLTVPGGADLDLYLYSETPDSKGNPVIRAASTNAGAGVNESINYSSGTTETAYLFIKRVSGSGSWSLNGALAGLCAPSPAAGCLSPAKSILILQDKAPLGASAKDKLIWKWLKGPALMQAGFGDPITPASDYTLCLYDSSGLQASLQVPGGGTCGAKPCWAPVGTSGYKFTDKAKSNGGVLKVILKGNASPGKSKVLIKGKDGNLPTPGLPLDDSVAVTVQLQRSDAATPCWESVFPAAATIKSSPGQYKAKF
jgi:hypothetical protein